ncbi:MAG TPA: SDR family oxidoreductase [Trebonia sp.]|jgi:NAD(P)-dependent dehydrogenase (short-subunit alcohol dehydrogenase family)
MTELAGSVVLVTGGAGGLGEATVRKVVAAGATAVIADLNDDKAGKLAADLGSAATYVRTDVTDEASVLNAIAEAEKLGTFRYAVVAHGGWGIAEKVVQRDGSPATLEGFKKTIDLYLVGTYNVLRLAAAAIAKTEPDADGQRGAVVLTASIAGIEGQIGQTSYGAAKAGVIGLTIVAARDLGSLGIRVVTIAPGTMKTPIMEGVGEEKLAKFAANIPNPKRLGAPAEYAALAAHIFENPYLNGETIRLDGAQRFGPR